MLIKTFVCHRVVIKPFHPSETIDIIIMDREDK